MALVIEMSKCFDRILLRRGRSETEFKCARHGCTTVYGVVAKLGSAKDRDWVVNNITQGRVRASKLSFAVDLGCR